MNTGRWCWASNAVAMMVAAFCVFSASAAPPRSATGAPVRGNQPSADPGSQTKAGAETKVAASDEKAKSSSGWLESQEKTGSTAESERAVELALQWLAEHQYPNGSWSFDHRASRCNGRCSAPGNMPEAVNAATGVGLLPFISHGNTHHAGPYSANVAAGLRFLIGRMGTDGSLREHGGRMYSHALATLAFCEDVRIFRETPHEASIVSSGETQPTSAEPQRVDAKARSPKASPTNVMSREEQEQWRQVGEKLVANAAAKTILYSFAIQDPRFGGWRYDTTPDSDISVTGWQTMATYSASRIDIPPPTLVVFNISRFLNAVQEDYGASYGYRVTEKATSPTRTAIGLLCRIYTGWQSTEPALLRGAQLLAKTGPSEQDMYYNYYATLVLHHLGGSEWEKWNTKMREYLIRTQDKSGHQVGSWSFHGSQSSRHGGRHLDTCLACLILEVYYRSRSMFSPGHTEHSLGENVNKKAAPPAANPSGD